MSKRTILGISMACMFAGLSCFTGCKKEGEKTALQVSDIAFTECISHREAGQKGHHHPDSVVVSCKRHTIYVTHHYLTVNCGWEHIGVLQNRPHPVTVLGRFQTLFSGLHIFPRNHAL